MIWIAHRCNDWDTIIHEVKNADVIEVDVVITKDNKLLLCHDLDHEGLIISQHASNVFKMIELPTLLRNIAKPIYIDVKWDPRVSPHHFAHHLYVQLLPFKHKWNKLYLFTFDVPLLECIRRKFGHHITIGWIIEDATLWNHSQDCDIVCADYKIAHQIMTRKPLFVFTVNHIQCLRHLRKVDGIVSDKVSFLKQQCTPPVRQSNTEFNI